MEEEEHGTHGRHSPAVAAVVVVGADLQSPSCDPRRHMWFSLGIVRSYRSRIDHLRTVFVVFTDLDDFINVLLLKRTLDDDKVVLLKVRNSSWSSLFSCDTDLFLIWVAQVDDSLFLDQTLGHPGPSFSANIRPLQGYFFKT